MAFLILVSWVLLRDYCQVGLHAYLPAVYNSRILSMIILLYNMYFVQVTTCCMPYTHTPSQMQPSNMQPSNSNLQWVTFRFVIIMPGQIYIYFTKILGITLPTRVLHHSSFMLQNIAYCNLAAWLPNTLIALTLTYNIFSVPVKYRTRIFKPLFTAPRVGLLM